MLLALTTACHGPRTPPSQVPDFRPDLASYALPLQAYLVADGDRNIYAARLFVRDCMRPHGVTIPAPDPRYERLPTTNAFGDTLFDQKIAETYGYHPGRPVGHRPAFPRLTTEQSRDNQACIDAATHHLLQNQDDVHTVEGFQSAAGERAFDGENVHAAAQRWTTCMRPLGLTDLPEDPTRMPTPSQRHMFFAADGHGTVTVAEIRHAVFDAQCRVSSGFSVTAYMAEVDAERATIRANRAKLARIITAADRVARAAAAFLRGRGR